jgi:hypothetical protein
MPNQILLAWTVDAAGSSIGPTQAAILLGAVPLYANADTDPVLGQLFGLTVASDATTTAGSTATRTLTLNMTSADTPTAPPPFPCQPNTAAPPVLPYKLQTAVKLPGTFAPTYSQTVVPSSVSQIPSIVGGGATAIQFETQLGVYYPVNVVGPASITLATPYTGVTRSTRASKQVAAPVTQAALYSSSPLDTAGVSVTTPAVPAGSGARTVSVSYLDSTGAGPFTVVTALTGRAPAPFLLAAGSLNIAVLTAFSVASTGAFGNSVGQITLAALEGPLAAVPPGIPIGTYLLQFTDQAQLELGQALAYLPPSYFALVQPGAAAQALPGFCTVTTGSKDVPTSVDLTGFVGRGSVLQFAVQPDTDTPTGRIVTLYTVAQCTPKLITLETPFTGQDPNNPLPNGGTLGLKSTQVQGLPTAATLFPANAAPPTSEQLAAAVGEFVDPTVALPPPNPPLPPATISAPTILSGLFARTLQLALAVPVVQQPITFA